MTRYVIKRILLALLTIFLICALTFFLMHAVPGGPFNREKALDAATIQALEERYGLNRPVGEQFLSYMKTVSYTHLPTGCRNPKRSSASLSPTLRTS